MSKKAAKPLGRQQAIAKALVGARKSLKANDLAAADSVVKQVLAADPMNLDALYLRANIARRAGNGPAAIDLLKRVVRLNPAHTEAHIDLGRMLLDRNELQEAGGHLGDAIKAQPKNAEAHQVMGLVLYRFGQLVLAEKELQQAVRVKPGLASAWADLAMVQSLAAKADEAVKSGRKAVSIDPKFATGHSRLATALDWAGQLDQALVAHQKAIALDPDAAELRIELARSLSFHGRIDEAIATYRELLARWPRHIGAYTAMASLKKFTDENDPDLQAMRHQLERPDITDDARVSLKFALGKAEEDLKNYPAAFAMLTSANQDMRKSFSYKPQTSDQEFEDLKSAFSADALKRLSGMGLSGAKPIFVIGMPRSGTSLTAQILGAHPDVVNAGELNGMNRMFSRLKGLTPDKTALAGVAELGNAHLTEWANEYRTEAQPYWSGDVGIVDKMPMNFRLAGLIKLAFPDATIVHTRRNPADTCLSIYKIKFLKGTLPYAYDLDEMARYYALYRDIMAHWEQVLPGQIYSFDYESLTEDPETQSRKLLAHCGLEWDPAVLDFHKSDSATHTASLAQVREPINTKAQGAAARYGDAAAPLFEALKRAGIS